MALATILFITTPPSLSTPYSFLSPNPPNPQLPPSNVHTITPSGDRPPSSSPSQQPIDSSTNLNHRQLNHHSTTPPSPEEKGENLRNPPHKPPRPLPPLPPFRQTPRPRQPRPQIRIPLNPRRLRDRNVPDPRHEQVEDVFLLLVEEEVSLLVVVVVVAGTTEQDSAKEGFQRAADGAGGVGVRFCGGWGEVGVGVEGAVR